MSKTNKIEEFKNVLKSKNTFEERYDYLIYNHGLSQVEMKKLDLENVDKNSNDILEDIVSIINTPMDKRQQLRLDIIQKNYETDIETILEDSLNNAKENLSEFLADPDGNGMGIHGYDKRIHNIYEKSMENFLQKAKEIVNKKDNITHLEEDNTITIFNKKDNGLEKIATIDLDDKDNMIVNISDIKMKSKILDYVEEIQENKIIQVNISKSSPNYLSDFHKRAQQIMEKESEKNNQKDINL